MKISQSSLKLDEEYPSSIMEITERQLIKLDCKRSFGRNCARHPLSLESQSHRNYGKINHRCFAIPKLSQIAKDKYSEMAFSILQYQLKDQNLKQTHINNLKLNLERRLQSAKANGDSQLVDLLTQEFRQITAL